MNLKKPITFSTPHEGDIKKRNPATSLVSFFKRIDMDNQADHDHKRKDSGPSFFWIRNRKW